MNKKNKIFLSLIACVLISSCSQSSNKKQPPSDSRASLQNDSGLLSPQTTKKLITGQAPPPKPEEVKTELKSEINKWWFGHGVGRTATNIGAIVVFPPWGLYLLANAGIALAGYEPAYITDALPEETRKNVLEVYDDVTAVPGRVNAAVAGRRFHSSPSIVKVTKKELANDEDKKSRDSSKIESFSSQRTSQRY